MDYSNYSISELINIYSQSIKELKNRGILRTKNVVGEIGEYLILEHYDRNPNLPNLSIVPLGTKNINAISSSGDRYSFKSTTGNVTGVVYGLQPKGSKKSNSALFEYMVICQMNEDCELEGIYQLSWESFLKHKKWHSRMNAWNIALTKAVKTDSLVVFEKNSSIAEGHSSQKVTKGEKASNSTDYERDTNNPISWVKTAKVNHAEVRERVVWRIQKKLKCTFEKESQSRYVTSDKEIALFVLSASYSEKNGEYWYSINDENIPWLELFPRCFIAFALGSSDNVLLFSYKQLSRMLSGCLRTKEDLEKKKKPHYHIAFSVDGSKVYFKQKKPTREFIDVSEDLI